MPGMRGATGATGPYGGAVTLPFTFSALPTHSAGFLALNAATLSATTAIFIDQTAFEALAPIFLSVLDGTNNDLITGHIRLVNRDNLDQWAIYSVPPGGGFEGGYFRFDITFVSSSLVVFNAGDSLLLHMDRPGEKGEQGETGATGATGRQGPPGVDGRDGLDGDAGPIGPRGVAENTGVASNIAIDGVPAATTVLAGPIYTIPRNSLSVGSIYRLSAFGAFTRGATATPLSITYNVVLEGTSYAICQHTTFTAAGTGTFRVEGWLHCLQITATSAFFVANLEVTNDSAPLSAAPTSVEVYRLVVASQNLSLHVTAKNVTTDLDLSLTVQMSAAVAGTVTRLMHCLITKAI